VGQCCESVFREPKYCPLGNKNYEISESKSFDALVGGPERLFLEPGRPHRRCKNKIFLFDGKK